MERGKQLRYIIPAVAAVIGLTACSKAGRITESEPTVSSVVPEQIVVTQESDLAEVTYTFADGMLEIDVRAQYSPGTLISAFCQGEDMVEVANQAQTEIRSVNHPACSDDGILTPEDFPPAGALATTTTTLG